MFVYIVCSCLFVFLVMDEWIEKEKKFDLENLQEDSENPKVKKQKKKQT